MAKKPRKITDGPVVGRFVRLDGTLTDGVVSQCWPVELMPPKTPYEVAFEQKVSLDLDQFFFDQILKEMEGTEPNDDA